jgi:hypothetical protein
VRHLAIVLVLSASATARAQEPSLSDVAAAERDEKLAISQVEAAHGNKPPQDLSPEERSQIAHEEQEASREVMERHALDPKAYAVRQMRMSPEDRVQVEAEKQRLDEQAEQARKAQERAAQSAAEPQEVEVQRGVSEKHPVDIYRAPDEVPVENLQDDEAPPEPPPPAKPAKGSKASKTAPQKSSRAKKSRNK